MARLLPVEMIPSSLWRRENSILHLPPQLISSWEKLLDKYQLKDQAMTKASEGFEGGITEEDTNRHLAWRFTGSCARVILAMLDPLQELHQISNIFVQIFSGNKVFLADLPCGSGSASVSILSVICELRKQGKVPRMPLHVVILGGEISESARKYAKEALESLRGELEFQAITFEFDVMNWDVCDKFSNTELIKKLILSSQNCSAKLLLLANFSGFLEGTNKWNNAQKQFDELFRYSQDNNSIALWIEPQKNNVVQNFFPRLLKWFKEKLLKLIGQDKQAEQSNYACSSVKVKHPLKEVEFKNHLAIVQFELPFRSLSTGQKL